VETIDKAIEILEYVRTALNLPPIQQKQAEAIEEEIAFIIDND